MSKFSLYLAEFCGGQIKFTPEETIYLVDDLSECCPDLDLLLEPYFDVLFEEELNSWHRLEED